LPKTAATATAATKSTATATASDYGVVNRKASGKTAKH
jgi:hypothetical protein